MALINMKRAPEKEEMPGAIEKDEPRYPYGLCIRLGKEELDKLGITALPAVGSEMTITAKVFVESTSAYETQGAGKDQSMSLQITDMEIGKSDKAMTSEKSATMLYGATE